MSIKNLINSVKSVLPKSIEELEAQLDKTKYRLVFNGKQWSYKAFDAWQTSDWNWTGGEWNKGQYAPDLADERNWHLRVLNATTCKTKLLEMLIRFQEEDKEEAELRSQNWEDSENAA